MLSCVAVSAGLCAWGSPLAEAGCDSSTPGERHSRTRGNPDADQPSCVSQDQAQNVRLHRADAAGHRREDHGAAGPEEGRQEREQLSGERGHPTTYQTGGTLSMSPDRAFPAPGGGVRGFPDLNLGCGLYWTRTRSLFLGTTLRQERPPLVLVPGRMFSGLLTSPLRGTTQEHDELRWTS